MSLEALVSELTETGLGTLNALKLWELKNVCKSGNGAHVASVFQTLLKALNKEHAQIRISSLQAINELFRRSHKFRLLAIGELPQILALTFGAYQKPLPRPLSQSAKLKVLATELLYAWVEIYGMAYQRLVFAFRFLRYLERVDFKIAAKTFRRRDPALVKRLRIVGEENKHEYMLRSMIAVRNDYMATRPAIEEALHALNACFGILMPEVADFLGDLCHANASDDDADVEEIMAVMAVNRHAINFDVNPNHPIDTEENSANAAVFDTIRDYLHSGVDSDLGGLVESIRKLKDRVVDMAPKCADLGVDLSYLSHSNGNFSDESDDEFEAVPLDFHRSHNSGEAGLEADPTYTRLGQLHSPVSHTLPASEFDTSNADRHTPVEERLLQTAPVVAFGPDLMYWDQNTINANRSGLEIRHRFLGSAREDPVLSGEAADSLRQRAIYYSDVMSRRGGAQSAEQQEIRACRAPLSSGRLCPRRDLIKCPLHGLVIDRDETGRPQGGFVEAKGEEEEIPNDPDPTVLAGNDVIAPRPSTIATAESINDLEWRDVAALISRKHPPPSMSLRAQQPKRQKKAPPGEPSALIDTRKQNSTSLNRLQRVLRKR
ncbi:hypothetical protein EV174_003308 [Coemansia sp. RSA 2320]|nr:hypothetical protein EV174_003308 [Coemansia sp. RSA 2320]